MIGYSDKNVLRKDDTDKGAFPMISAESIMKMLESSYDGVWITDGAGNILYANSANAALLGVKKEELLGKSTQQLLDEHIFSDSVIMEVIKTRKQATRISHNERTDLTVLATATPIFDARGGIEYIFNNVRDITALNSLRDNLKDKEAIIRSQERQLQEIRTRYGMDRIVTASQEFARAVEVAERVAAFDGATVLILGESGTGKEVIADIIVQHSQRREAPFVKINCGAIPENLLESELFGYEKGAFTGADARGKAGLFEAANGGTIFLDEIGDMPYHLQVKLLRVLQQREITRVGSTTQIPLDVRVITATNRDLEQMVEEKTFREDLYYRLNVVTIAIPPLRDRREDIIPLASHFLNTFNKKYKTAKRIHPDVMYLLEDYAWPGNVRELENLIENLVIMSREDTIMRSDLPGKIFAGRDKRESAMFSEIIPLKEAVEQVELDLIRRAMEKYGSARKAAAVLGVNASTVLRKLQSGSAGESGEEP